VAPIRQALPAIASGHSPNGGTAIESVVMKIWLPPKNEALCLLERYAEYITFLHHVVHIPSVRLLLDDGYKKLSLGHNVAPGHIALLLSIFASTAYTLEASTADPLFLNQANATNCAISWTKAALDTLDNSRRNLQGSVEDVQATILLSFIIFNLEGFSLRFRTLSCSALIMARDLSLHRIDADSCAKKESSVQLEIKRRIWWLMVSTDWWVFLSFCSYN
jgi:hypothetical protein